MILDSSASTEQESGKNIRNWQNKFLHQLRRVFSVAPPSQESPSVLLMVPLGENSGRQSFKWVWSCCFTLWALKIIFKCDSISGSYSCTLRLPQLKTAGGGGTFVFFDNRHGKHFLWPVPKGRLNPSCIVGWWPVWENKLLTFHYSGIRTGWDCRVVTSLGE